LFFRYWRGAGFARAQAGLILIAIVSVWVANIVYVSGHSPLPNMDITPIAFTIVAGAMAWGFFRYNLLNLLPVARTEVFREIEDAILVFDGENRIADYNPAADHWIRRIADQRI
jgi:hypothetical protein